MYPSERSDIKRTKSSWNFNEKMYLQLQENWRTLPTTGKLNFIQINSCFLLGERAVMLLVFHQNLSLIRWRIYPLGLCYKAY